MFENFSTFTQITQNFSQNSFHDLLKNFLFGVSAFTQQIPYLGLITAIFFLLFAYKKFRALPHLLIFAIYFSSFKLCTTFWVLYAILSILLIATPLRRNLVSRPIIFLIKKLGLLPKISETEKIALTSGTVWVDGELFSGNPDFTKIFSQKYPSLNEEEKSFLDNEVEELCRICIDYEVQKLRDLPENVWNFLSDKKFFGMIIPKDYGGLGFSAFAHSCVIEKLASRSVPLAITAMVPNSLGPAELLLHYGTKEQQDYYLPRLADGRELPCFALTEPTAGSDATSIISRGEIFQDINGEIKIRLNWNKRYITLGAYATLIGVAFQLRDPLKIISDNEEIGITCALIPSDTTGVRQGRRHDPLATPFVNSPLNGENVVIGFEQIIGAENGLGKGWKMLMECLAAGRGISLPSTASGGSKLVARATTAYSAIREQFGTSISKFEGIEEVLARIASRTYAVDAMRAFTASAVDAGAKPAVISAIAKYHATEIFRQNINDGMDIMGGSGIIRGSRNILANAYFSAPISITVEGANIMTRSLIQFGQGAIMSHPYAYKEILALEKHDVAAFDHEFFSHINHLFSNLSRSILLSLTRGHFSLKITNCKKTTSSCSWKSMNLSCLKNIKLKDFCPMFWNCGGNKNLVSKYQRKIAWCSATFALLADFALARFGGNLKRKEKVNGRFGDVLSAMYLSVCILKKFEHNGCKKDEEAIVEHALKEQFCKAQSAIDGLYQNLFGCIGRVILFPFAMWSRLNSFTCPASDNLGHRVVQNLVKNGEERDALTNGIYVSKNPSDNLGRLENAMLLQEKAQNANQKIKSAIKSKILPRKPIYELVNLAFDNSIIDLKEKHDLEDSLSALLDAVQVDEYSLQDYKNIH